MRKGKKQEEERSGGSEEPSEEANLRALQKLIRETEKNLKKGIEGASLEVLEHYCEVYNRLLVKLFGEEGALRVPNYRVEKGKAETFVPSFQRKRAQEARDRKSGDASIIGAKAGFDDDLTKKRRRLEKKYVPRDPKIEIKVSKTLPKGMVKLRITSTFDKEVYTQYFKLDARGLNDLKRTISDKTRLGDEIEIIYNKTDYYHSSLVRPPVGSNPALN